MAVCLAVASICCSNITVAFAQENDSVYSQETAENESAATAGTEGETPEITECGLSVRTHVQTYGWQDEKGNGEIAGTEGEAKRLEGLQISLIDQPYEGSIEYRTHVETYGWQEWKKDGETAGTEGESKRLEAVQIRLTGEMADHFDLYYRVHLQNYGWLSYVENGSYAGSEGFGLRMEAIEIHLVPKNTGESYNTGNGFLKNVLRYSGHVQDIGNVSEVQGGTILGTIGKKKRLEAISVKLSGLDGYCEGNIEYTSHIQDIGWQEWKKDGYIRRRKTIGGGKNSAVRINCRNFRHLL